MIFPAQYKAKLEFADRIRRGDAAAVRHLDELNAKFAHDVSGHVDLLEDPQWAPKPPPLPPDSIHDAFQSQPSVDWDLKSREHFARLIKEIAENAPEATKGAGS
jgi:hypothetical protein